MPKPKGESDRRGLNKSAAIREMLGQNPDATVKEIVNDFDGRGIHLNPNLVYIVKSKMQSRHRRQKRNEAVAASEKAGITNPVELVRKVKELAREAGGYKRFKELLEIMSS